VKESVPPEVWDLVEARDRVCQASAYGFGSVVPCSGWSVVHHRRLRSQGGVHDPAVLVLLCNGHHVEVHNNPRRAAACGLILRAQSD
jgi:hypothetical protein